MYPTRGAPNPVLAERAWRLDDPLRLQAMAEYHDPDPQRLHQLQEVVALAGRLIRAELAMLVLVHRDRVVVQALQGTRVQAAIAVTPVWEAILGSDPLFVWQADPLEDAAEIPTLTPGAAAPGLFVAAPLVSPEQAVLGALCVSDPVPRRLSADDRAMLTMLARQAMSLMELHRVIRREAGARREAAGLAARMQLAFSLAGLGDWTWTPARGDTTLSARAAQIFDLPSGQPIDRHAFRAVVAPEHRERLRREFEAAIRERRDLHLEYRLRQEHGAETWVQTHATGRYDDLGRIVEMVGVVQDISARRLAEAQMRIREDRAWMKAELIKRVQDLDNPGDVAIQASRVIVERLGLRGGGFRLIGAAGELRGVGNHVVGEYVVDERVIGERVIGEHAAAVDAAAELSDAAHGLGLQRLDPDLLQRLSGAVPVEIDLGGRGQAAEAAGEAAPPRRTALLCPLVRRGRPASLFWFEVDRERGWRDGEAQTIQSIVDLAFAYYGRAQARGSAKAGERRLLLIADWMPQLAWLANSAGRSIWFNQRWLEYGGYPLERLIDGGWLALCHPDDRAEIAASVQRAMVSDGGWEATFRLRRADGQYRWHLSRAISFATGNDEEPLLWFATLTDVTEQRQLAEKREALLETERLARREAESASRLKDEFLATLSHELRTPLTAMLGWSQVLRRTDHDPGLVRQGVEIIERNANIQSQIVEDLLDMSAIASGKLRLDCRPTGLRDLLAAAIDAVLPLARTRRIRIDLILPDGDLEVAADAARLQQVMNNLLINALKFSPPSSAIRVMMNGRRDQVEIVVADQGIGMAAEFLPHVFERFRQADGSNTRLHGGLGLGLAIVRQLLDLHGGSIVADSPGLGRGSTFTIRLPRQPNAAA